MVPVHASMAQFMPMNAHTVLLSPAKNEQRLYCFRTSRSLSVKSSLFGRILAAAIGVSLAVLPTRASDADSIIDRWCAAQTHIHTWTADLTQTRTLKVLSQPLYSTGSVWVAMPNRFRWEIGNPPQTIALRQPDQLMLIYPRLKRAEKYPLTEAQNGPWKDAMALLDASFPKSRQELESRFSIQSIRVTNSLVELFLQPKSPAARKFMTGVLVSFHTNEFTPVATELRFGDGSSMRNDFTNTTLNVPIPDDLFEAKLGPDYKTVEPLKQ
jgi:outer membrane lipoprotein-sorting protein